ncbi:hypothetical protein DL95DRAFT_152355 [Leptodontidium sp. 2 PMI_412]|nr:hypothetical protein DL95DRAFT_152355 [Leptodontidium sp. 2 PMI_412]
MLSESVSHTLLSSSAYARHQKGRLERSPPPLHPACQTLGESASPTSSRNPTSSSACSSEDPGYPTPPATPPLHPLFSNPHFTSSPVPLKRPAQSTSAPHACTGRKHEHQNQRELQERDDDEDCIVYENDLVDGVVLHAERGEVCIVLEVGTARTVRMTRWRQGFDHGDRRE